MDSPLLYYSSLFSGKNFRKPSLSSNIYSAAISDSYCDSFCTNWPMSITIQLTKKWSQRGYIIVTKKSHHKILNMEILMRRFWLHFLTKTSLQIINLKEKKDNFILLILWDLSLIFIGPESDHWLCLSVTHWLTD